MGAWIRSERRNGKVLKDNKSVFSRVVCGSGTATGTKCHRDGHLYSHVSIPCSCCCVNVERIKRRVVLIELHVEKSVWEKV